VLPQQYRDAFDALDIGIDIDDLRYGAWWDAHDHLSNHKEYNNRWEEFFRRHEEAGTEPTLEEIEDFAEELADEFGRVRGKLRR